MFTFFTTLLQFLVEYNIEKKQLSDVLPFVVFADTQDTVLKMNPGIRNNTFKHLRSDFTDLKKDNIDIDNKSHYISHMKYHRKIRVYDYIII